MDFRDRRVWITGASSGIGEALAVAFHQAGARLVLSARREDELKRVQTLCGGEPNTRILPMDVTNAAELPQKTQRALGMFSGIDILVLNAGITQRSLTRDTDESVYRRLMEVNFFATEAHGARSAAFNAGAKERTHGGDLKHSRQIWRATALRLLRFKVRAAWLF